jgi:hypothetical protein
MENDSAIKMNDKFILCYEEQISLLNLTRVEDCYAET